MTLGQKWDIEIIWPFCGFLDTKVANLGPIDFQLGLPLNINRNEGQNRFEVHISKNVSKMAHFRPKIGQDATFANLYLNFLKFWSTFCSKAAWAALGLWTQTQPQVVGTCPDHGRQPIGFPKFLGLNPPLLRVLKWRYKILAPPWFLCLTKPTKESGG